MYLVSWYYVVEKLRLRLPMIAIRPAGLASYYAPAIPSDCAGSFTCCYLYINPTLDRHEGR